MTPAGGTFCLDISLSTGWCYGAAGMAAPEGGVWKLGGMKMGRGYLASCMLNMVEVAIQEYEPARVLFESPISKDQTTDRVLKYLCGAVETACYEASVPCYEVAAPTARAMVLGRGMFIKPWRGRGKWVMKAVRGSKTGEKVKTLVGDAKEEIGIYMREHGYQFVDDNHADAILLWLYDGLMGAQNGERT